MCEVSRSADHWSAELRPDTQNARHSSEAPIQRPERCISDQTGCKEVNVNPADAASHQVPRLDQSERVLLSHDGGLRKRLQQGQDLFPVSEVSARQLTDDERMTNDFASL